MRADWHWWRRFICLHPVENRLSQTRDCSLLIVFQLQGYDLIVTFLQPDPRKIKSLLRPDVPESSEMMPIHPHIPLSPAVHVEKSATGLFELENPAMEGGPCHRPGRAFQAPEHLAIKRERVDFQTRQLA